MTHLFGRAVFVVVLALLSWLALPGSAHAAITCDVVDDPAELAFGTLNLPLNQNTTSTEIGVRCMRSQNNDSNRVLMCLGTEANTSPRTMNRITGPADTLTYNYYSDPGYSQVVNYTNNASATINLPQRNVWYSANVRLYGRLSANQLDTTPGDYLHQINNAVYGYSGAGNANCAMNVNPAGTYVLRATAKLQGSCTIAAQPLNFGNHNNLSVARDAQTSLTVTCTNGTPYTVKLDGGRSGSFNPRRMSLNGMLGGPTIDYNLYTDAARSLVWGVGGGNGNTVLGQGTGNGQGNPQVLTVYGRVPPVASFIAGAYRDTVTATVEY